jgi:rhodanese-related sulfurtransferase
MALAFRISMHKSEPQLRTSRIHKPPTPMSAIELRLRLADGDAPTLVDVREAPAYHARHLAGAVHAPDSQTTALVRKMQLIPSAVLICDDGKASALVARTLAFCGFTDLVYLDGGLAAWVKAGGFLVETTRSGFEHLISADTTEPDLKPKAGGTFFSAWFRLLGSRFGLTSARSGTG